MKCWTVSFWAASKGGEYAIRLLSKDRKWAPVASCPFPFIKLLFPETIQLCKILGFIFSLSIEEMTRRMEDWWNRILATGTNDGIDEIACDNKDFNSFPYLIVDLIYDIQHLCDDFLYDIMQLQVDDLPQAEAYGYSELRSVIQMIIIQGVQASLIPMIKLEFSGKVSKCFNLWSDVIRRKVEDIHLVTDFVWWTRGSQGNSEKRCETSPYLDLVVIGRDREKKKILDWLSPVMNPDNNFSTIAIVGQGGLGKTSLARLVFNDDWVSKYFNLRMWINVPDDFNVPKIMRRMIDSAIGIPKISENFTSLEFNLMSKLEGRRLLLVLDDVWNEDPRLWEFLKHPLLAAECTRVIVTTRSVKVAEIMQTANPVRLGYLSEANSLEILKQCAFQHHSPEKLPSLMEMGKHIVKKCGGLPLAVKALANYLRFKHDSVERIDAIPDEVLMEEIFPTLKISYNRLSTQLKCCFIYCSMFPRCYGFTKDELVRLWIAQGYIWGIDPKEVEDTGNECFDQLNNSSFFDFSHCEANAVRVFTIPVFIHSLAKHIAGSEYLALNELQCIPENVRHLFVGSTEIIKHLSPATAMKLRTFLLHMTTFHGSLDFILDMMRVRALILIIHNVQELPGLIGNVLKSLRYLRIESYLMEKLP